MRQKNIQLVGLSKKEYNGMCAERVRYNRKKRRYVVRLEEGREVLIDPLKTYVLKIKYVHSYISFLHSSVKKPTHGKPSVRAHCGVHREYYANESHWSRPSCRKSPSGHHSFALRLFVCCCCASFGEEEDDDSSEDEIRHNDRGPLVVGMLR